MSDTNFFYKKFNILYTYTYTYNIIYIYIYIKRKNFINLIQRIEHLKQLWNSVDFRFFLSYESIFKYI